MTRVEEIVDYAAGYVAEGQSAYAYPIVPPPPKSRGQPTAWGPPALYYILCFTKINIYIYVSSLYYILKPRLIILLPQSREFDIFNIEKNKLELNLSLLLTFDRIFFSFFRRKENGTLRKDCNREKESGGAMDNGQWTGPQQFCNVKNVAVNSEN